MPFRAPPELQELLREWREGLESEVLSYLAKEGETDLPQFWPSRERSDCPSGCPMGSDPLRTGVLMDHSFQSAGSPLQTGSAWMGSLLAPHLPALHQGSGLLLLALMAAAGFLGTAGCPFTLPTMMGVVGAAGTGESSPDARKKGLILGALFSGGMLSGMILLGSLAGRASGLLQGPVRGLWTLVMVGLALFLGILDPSGRVARSAALSGPSRVVSVFRTHPSRNVRSFLCRTALQRGPASRLPPVRLRLGICSVDPGFRGSARFFLRPREKPSLPSVRMGGRSSLPGGVPDRREPLAPLCRSLDSVFCRRILSLAGETIS